MNKEQAAEFLGISVRTLQRHVQRGELQSTEIKVEKGGQLRRETVFDREELERFKANPPQQKKPSVTAMTVTTPQAVMSDTSVTTDKAVMSAQPVTSDGFQRLLTAIESQSVGQKVLLTLKDCRQLTGLSGEYLREAIHAGELKARIIGRGWKVKRSDLDAYVKKL
jgi:excisionase family DNA binding protein